MNLKYPVIFVIISFLTLVVETFAQSKTVEVENNVAFPRDRTRAEVEQQAIGEALAEAVRQVVGVQVQGGELLWSMESQDQLEEQYSQIVRLDAAGKATHWEILENRISKFDNLDYLHIRLRVTVEFEKGLADPSFKVKLDLNDRLFLDRGRVTDNDEIIVNVQTTHDAYITIFIISEDSVQILYPNALMEDNFLSAGRVFEFPPPDWRARGFRLRAMLLPGHNRTFELISVVATKKHIPFVNFRSKPLVAQDGKQPLFQSSFMDLNRWLVNIPLDQRATAEMAYEIRKIESK